MAFLGQGGLLQRFGQELGAPGTLATQQAEQKKQQDLQQFGNILTGQSFPEFLRPGGAEALSPQEFERQQLVQLGALGTPEAAKVLTARSPLTQPTTAPLSPVGKIQADITAGRIDPQTGKALIKQAIGGDAGLQERKQKLDERKFDQDVKEFEQKVKTGGLDQKDVFEQTQKLRKEFTGLSGEFIKQRDAFGRVQASVEDPSAAGDLALIFNFMKVLDPGSTVREGEFATAANSAGVDDRLRAQYNKVATGERLADKQRNDFSTRATKLFAKADKQHNKRVEQFTGVAERAGLNIEDVLLDLGLAETPAKPAAGAQGEGTIATNPQTGAKVILRGGQWQPL